MRLATETSSLARKSPAGCALAHFTAFYEKEARRAAIISL